ncbi:type I-C CRISPR-associated protein Cas8c/Csd1 [Atopobiaceae bacterium HCP3S3_A4]
MLLQALNDYYYQLLDSHPDEVVHPGWSSCKVAAILAIDSTGKLANVIPYEDAHGKSMMVPEQAKHSSNIKPYFLAHNSTYLLGVDKKGKPEDAFIAFEASKELHHNILDGVESPVAQAILSFFDQWDPFSAEQNPVVQEYSDSLFSGRFLVFGYADNGMLRLATEDEAIKTAWMKFYFAPNPDDMVMRCLVTGERKPIARLHPAIKGIKKADGTSPNPSGSSLVSFNNTSENKYGHVKGLNAPVSKEAAQAYGAALNYLLSSPIHHTRIGDTNIVYWSRENDEANSRFLKNLLFPSTGSFKGDELANEQLRLDQIVKTAVSGRYQDEEDLDLQSPFYIAGLAPNAARVSVRFFMVGTFGKFVANIAEHYSRTEIVHSPASREYLSPFALLHEVENPNTKKPISESPLCAPLMRAILSNARYPEGLYQSAIVRIHSSQNDKDTGSRKVSRGMASIIRAYLIKNEGLSREEITVDLNEERTSVAYSLGRVFAILEALQKRANGTTNLANRYMDSASTTPGVVFPVLLRLANAHLNKISHDAPGLAGWYKKQIAALLGEDRVQAFPSRLTLSEQGEFFLGYYHQFSSSTNNNSEAKEQ